MLDEREWNCDELFKAVRDIEGLLPRLEKFSAEVATELSGTRVSPKMFQRLGGMWLLHLTHQVAGLPRSTASGPVASDLMVPVDGYTHHQMFVISSEYRTQVAKISRGDWAGVNSLDGNLKAVRTAVPTRSRLSRVVERSIHRLSPDDCPTMVSYPYLKIHRLEQSYSALRSRNKIAWLDPEPLNPVVDRVNQALRFSIARGVTGDELFAQTCRLVALMLPSAYGEGLMQNVDALRNRYRQPRLLYSANGSQFQLPYQVLSAVWGESGTRVLSHQHGGHQGLDDLHAGEEYEIRASDRHFTLGWKDTRQNVVPLCTAMPRRANSTTRNRLLLMSLSTTDVIYRLQPFCIPSHVTKCTEESRDFLTELEWNDAPILRCDQQVLDQLSTARSDVKWEAADSSGTLSASRSAIVVHNYLGASWLETLAMDIPTVCFIPKNIHRFRESAQPFADALIRVGILHDSGCSAARFVNSLGGDPSGWWKSAEVQEARQAFVARYANFSDDWLDAWLAEFERMLAE